MILKVLGVFVAIVTSSITLGVPKRFVLYSGLTGAVGQLVYLLAIKGGVGIVSAVFIGTIAVSLICHSLARIFKAPVTIFFIPGILPMVPGLSMYRAVYNLITGYEEKAFYYLLETLQIAGMIALAIFIMDSIFRIFQKKK